MSCLPSLLELGTSHTKDTDRENIEFVYSNSPCSSQKDVKVTYYGEPLRLKLSKVLIERGQLLLSPGGPEPDSRLRAHAALYVSSVAHCLRCLFLFAPSAYLSNSRLRLNYPRNSMNAHACVRVIPGSVQDYTHTRSGDIPADLSLWFAYLACLKQST